MRHILWLLAFVPSMLVAQTPQKPTTDTVVTIIKRTPNVVTCAPCKTDSLVSALTEELKRQKQSPAQSSGGTLTKVTAVTSFLALAGVVYLIFRKHPSSPKDTYGDEEMELKP